MCVHGTRAQSRATAQLELLLVSAYSTAVLVLDTLPAPVRGGSSRVFVLVVLLPGTTVRTTV